MFSDEFQLKSADGSRTLCEQRADGMIIMYDTMTDYEVGAAVARLQSALPGWWFSMGRCGLTCHASVGPDRAFIEEPFLSRYDSGFHADIPNPTTLAAALDAASSKALSALAEDAEWQTRPTQSQGDEK